MFVYLIMGLVLLFPLSTDPLRKIPRVAAGAVAARRAREHWMLRLASPWINPLTWVTGRAARSGRRGRTISVGLWATDRRDCSRRRSRSRTCPRRDARHVAPRARHFPGRSNQLVRKNLREILSTLDFYCAPFSRYRYWLGGCSGPRCRTKRSWR